MTKDKFKEVITGYFYYVYLCYNKESELTDNSVVDIKHHNKRGLPIYVDHPTEFKRKFRELAKKYHTDNGGDSAKFIELIEKYKDFII